MSFDAEAMMQQLTLRVAQVLTINGETPAFVVVVLPGESELAILSNLSNVEEVDETLHRALTATDVGRPIVGHA